MEKNPDALAARIVEHAQRQRRPEAPRDDESCREFAIRIARDGTWFYHGSPIGRKPLVKLFASVLRRDDKGAYWLITPAERGRIEVDDAPFAAVELRAEGEGKARALVFRTNVDDEVTADDAHPIRVETDAGTGEPSPYVLVRDRLEARITRAVFYQLVDLGETREIAGKRVFGVASCGAFFALGTAGESW